MDTKGIHLRRLHRARGHVPPVLQYGWANKKLAKVYWPSRKRSRLFVLVEPKERKDMAKIFPALCAGRVATTFEFVPAPLRALEEGDCSTVGKRRPEKLSRRWLNDGCVRRQAMMSKRSGDDDGLRHQRTGGIPQQQGTGGPITILLLLVLLCHNITCGLC